MHYSHLIIAILIGFIFPVYAMVNGGKTRYLLEQDQNKLTAVLQSTALFLLTLCGLVLFSMYLNETDLALIGLSFVFNPTIILYVVFASFCGYWLFSKMSIPEDKIDKLKNSHKDVLYLFPENKKQYNNAIVLSIIAGVCEEIMFRGFLYWQLLQYMPNYMALILTNIMFAMGHAGTKFKNAISTFILGLLFAACYLLVDSLWLPITLHILVDFYAMNIGYQLKHKLKSIKNTQ